MSDVLESMFKLLETSLSESNYQLQDLNCVKDDLSLLKLGLFLLQDTNSKLSAESIRQLYYLKNLKERLESQGTSIETLVNTAETLEQLLEQCLQITQEAHHPCGGSGWKKVADLDMARLTDTCPTGWTETGYSKRTCGRTTTTANSCDQTFITATDAELSSYSRVCGRIEAYVFGGPDGFDGYRQDTSRTLSENFMDGVTLYYGNPPAHIWTFVAGVSESPESQQQPPRFCPCDRPDAAAHVAPYIEQDYFCESRNDPYPVSGSERLRFYADDKLWDGENCLETSNCCEQNRPPYFVKTLDGPTSEDIVASLCLKNVARGSNIAVEIMEIYVHE